MDTQRKYDDAKADYRKAGRDAKGKPRNSQEWKEYQQRKAEYHKAGRELREENHHQ